RNGALDSAFGTGGESVTDVDSTSGATPSSLLIQKDGKMVVAGHSLSDSSLTVARYNTDGTLDTTFAASGIGIYNGTIAIANKRVTIAQQADGKLLIPVFGGIVRLTESGSLDATFGTAGIALPSATAQAAGESYLSVATQKDGKIVAFGADNDGPAIARFNSDGTPDSAFPQISRATAASFDYHAYAFDGYIGAKNSITVGTTVGLVRYTSAAAPDTTFGHGGASWNPNGITGQIDASALQKDGKIVVAGSESAVDGSVPAEAALARYDADGSLDRTFGDNGRVFVAVGDDADLDALVIQRDGRIAAGGYADVGGMHQFLVLRVSRSGHLDRTFDRNGILTSSFAGATSQSVAALALGPANTLVAAGSADEQMAVERILGNGKLDPSFATGGQVALQPEAQTAGATGLLVAADGGITIGGTIGGNFGMIRLLSSGAYDTAFGSAGVVTTTFADAQGNATPSQANALIADANGNLILGGSTGGFGDDPLLPLGGLALARYHADGSLDSSFGNGGKLTDYAAGDFFLIKSLAIQSDGKIVAGGLSSGQVAVARLTDQGLDTTFGFLGVDPVNASLPIAGISYLGGPGFPGKPDDAPVTSVLVEANGGIIAAHGTSLSRLTSS
ncbi:MAG TPA: hypothetical protein VFE47_25620, partial [Tepidisphaeraceae bacterium]|nr:hypothetical protein [Tepidisphaeraceae bacterium]